MNSLNLRKRAAFEIGVNFIVIVILSIAILSSGIYLFYKLYHSAVVFKDNVDQQTNDRINALLDNGEMFIIVDNSQVISNGKSGTFAYGVNNKLGIQQTFDLNCIKVSCFDDNENPCSSSFSCSNIQFTHSFPLQNNEHTSRLIMVTMPSNAVLGRYIVIFKLMAGSTQYSKNQSITVTNK